MKPDFMKQPTQDNQRIDDEDVQILARLSQALHPEYEALNRHWRHSPFEWILKRPSRQRGKIGEQLIAGWCTAKDLNVSRSPDSQADKIIEGKRIEIKFSTLWQNGTYTFQQLRDQRYDAIIFVGLSPFNAHVWICLKTAIPWSQLKHQHGGVSGRDTWWFKVNPAQPPSWLGSSGRLADVYRALTEFQHA